MCIILMIMKQISQDPTIGMSSSPKRMSIPQVSARIHAGRVTVERQTQTEIRVPRWKQVLYCLSR